MLPLRFTSFWRTASLILLAFVLAAALMPEFWGWPDEDELGSWVTHFDKWLHGITFVVLALWFAGQYRPQSYWRIATGLLAFGALIEIIQGAVAYRSAEWFDMAANATGIGVGLAIALVGAGGWCIGFEKHLVPAREGAGGD